MTRIIPKRQQYATTECVNSHADNSPHLRLTFEAIRERRAYMRCDQYLADSLASMKAIGWTFIIRDLPAFCEKIGLSMRTFQRARRLLIDAGKLIEQRINRDSIEFFLVRDYDKLVAQDDTTIAQDDQPIAQNDQPIAVTPLEPALQAELSDTSDLLSDPLSDLLSLPQPETERESLEIIQNGKPTPAFKNCLEEQARKMPRAIANIPVWVSAMSKRDEWQSAFSDWQKRLVEAQCSALSPSTDYFVAPKAIELSDEDLAKNTAARLAARLSLKISSPREYRLSGVAA